MIELTRAHRRRVVLAAAAAIVLAISATIWLTRSGSPARPVAQPSPAPATSASPTAAPTPSPTASRTTPPVPHEFVAAAAPTSFTYRSPRFTIRAHVCGMEYVRPLDPPGEQHHTVCWVQHDFGFAPGSRGRGTTYVLGHSWGQDPLEVLNKISQAAMRQVLPEIAHHRYRLVSHVATYPVTALSGDVITLRTPRGVLRYTVRGAYAVAKSEAGYVAPLMAEHTRHRVVIITCGELHHVDYDYNIIVSAYLTSSVATGSPA